VLSASLNQNFNAWILTPEETTKARQHNVYSAMFVVTEPLPDCMNVYLPLASHGSDKPLCLRIYEALATQPAPGAPARKLINPDVRLPLSSTCFLAVLSVTFTTYVNSPVDSLVN
jgi:hypothetical protein